MTDDLFEEIFNIENTLLEKGEQDGYEAGIEEGFELGRNLGMREGQTFGEEMGFYRGCIDAVREVLIRKPFEEKKKEEKVKRMIERLDDLLTNFEMVSTNDHLIETRQLVRAKFKVLMTTIECKHLLYHHQQQQQQKQQDKLSF